MSINPQYTFDSNGNPTGVFLSIEEWRHVAAQLQIHTPQVHLSETQIKNIAPNPYSLLNWEDIRRDFK